MAPTNKTEVFLWPLDLSTHPPQCVTKLLKTDPFNKLQTQRWKTWESIWSAESQLARGVHICQDASSDGFSPFSFLYEKVHIPAKVLILDNYQSHENDTIIVYMMLSSNHHLHLYVPRIPGLPSCKHCAPSPFLLVLEEDQKTGSSQPP